MHESAAAFSARCITMSLFDNYRSGDADASDMKPSYKVSEIVGKKFRITGMKRLDASKSKYSDDPTMLVNAIMCSDAEEFVFFAQQKVLFDKLTFLLGLANEGNREVYETEFRIILQPTKDGKANYYDIIDSE